VDRTGAAKLLARPRNGGELEQAQNLLDRNDPLQRCKVDGWHAVRPNREEETVAYVQKQLLLPVHESSSTRIVEYSLTVFQCLAKRLCELGAVFPSLDLDGPTASFVEDPVAKGCGKRADTSAWIQNSNRSLGHLRKHARHEFSDSFVSSKVPTLFTVVSSC
jgi:hypothetical protein